MPVEIKELIIRAIVAPTPEPPPAAAPGRLSEEEQEAIVAACVRQVLQILARARER